MGTIASGIKSGITLFSKGNAVSVAINSSRMTADAFDIYVSPLLAVTKSIDIVSEAPASSTMTESDHYIFLNDHGQVVHRTKSGDIALLGSEHIISLDFSIPVSSSDAAENYMLSISFSAQYKEQETMKHNAALSRPLFNRPAKSGNNVVSNSYQGSVLHVVCINYLRILNGETGASAAEATLTTNTLLTADYAVYDTDEAIRWFVATSSSDATVSVDTKTANGYMAITDTSGDLISSDYMHPMPSDDIYVKTSSGHEKYSEGTYYIRYAIGAHWSPWVKIVKPSSGHKYKASDKQDVFENGTVVQQSDYLQEIMKDISSVYAAALSQKQGQLNNKNNKKYGNTGVKDFTTYIVDTLLSDLGLSDFVQETTEFYIGYDDDTYELTGITFKVNSYAYAVYPNGHVYKYTNTLWSSPFSGPRKESITYTEDFFTARPLEEYIINGSESRYLALWMRIYNTKQEQATYAIDVLLTTSYISASDTTHYFKRYFSTRNAGASLDSEGVYWGIPAKAELSEALGFDVSNCSWRIYMRKGDDSNKGTDDGNAHYNIFFTFTNISDVSLNTTVEVYMCNDADYHLKNEANRATTFYMSRPGTMTVTSSSASGTTIHVLRGDSYTPYE